MRTRQPTTTLEHLRMPVIGHVPAVKSQAAIAKKIGSALDPYLVSYFRPKSSSSEAFKAIRTALYFSNRGGHHKVIQVTSPTPGDGKSTIAANLAITMAQSGKSVLLLDTDLRRPRVQKLFGIDHECGLAWLLDQLPKSPSTEQVREFKAEVLVALLQGRQRPQLGLFGYFSPAGGFSSSRTAPTISSPAAG